VNEKSWLVLERGWLATFLKLDEGILLLSLVPRYDLSVGEENYKLGFVFIFFFSFFLLLF